MIEAGLALLALGALFLVALPLMVVGVVVVTLLKLVFALILLPLKAAAWGASGLFSGLFFIMQAFGALLLGGLFLVLGLALFAVPLLSLTPLFLLIGLCWLAWRMLRGPARAQART